MTRKWRRRASADKAFDATLDVILDVAVDSLDPSRREGFFDERGFMLPMLADAAWYFQYQRMVPSLRPGKFWDTMLWMECGSVVDGVR